jgi:hypothetical protein
LAGKTRIVLAAAGGRLPFTIKKPAVETVEAIMTIRPGRGEVDTHVKI